MNSKFPVSLAVALAACSSLSVPAAVISSGYATLTMEQGLADSIDQFNALFNASATRAETLSDPAPGNAPFTTSGNLIQYDDPIRPNGVIPSPYPGTPGVTRSPQITNLDFNPADILGSWAPSTDQFGVFVPLGTGEQIALTSMQRWTGPFTGSLLYGDFGLRYLPDRAGTVTAGGTLSGLVLASNIDFLNSSWADLADATIVFDSSNNELSIQGSLLISGALNVLDPSAVVGTPFGTFNMTASVVPEPAAGALVGVGALAAGILLRRRRQAS